MKKFAVVISILLLVFCYFSAFGEGIDLDSLNDDELSELYDNVREEMFARGVIIEEDFAFGDYVVGKDIRAGSYTLIFSNVVNRTGAQVYIYKTSVKDENGLVFHEFVRNNGNVSISLEDGMLLSIKQISASMRITNVRSSFAP